MDHEEENPGIVYGDDLEKAIDRYTFEDEEDNELIETIILKQILDHFMPKWRKRTDPHYKLKKFATEQQLDKNLNKIREYVDIKCRLLSEEISKMREFIDEFEAEAAEVRKIIEADRIATEKIRMRMSRK